MASLWDIRRYCYRHFRQDFSRFAQNLFVWAEFTTKFTRRPSGGLARLLAGTSHSFSGGVGRAICVQRCRSTLRWAKDKSKKVGRKSIQKRKNGIYIGRAFARLDGGEKCRYAIGRVRPRAALHIRGRYKCPKCMTTYSQVWEVVSADSFLLQCFSDPGPRRAVDIH